jgi:hypothetical protein
MTELRSLKYIAIFMVILVVITLLLVGYFFTTASVSIAAYGATGRQCADSPEEFERIKASLAEETFIGTRFSNMPIGNAEEYALITYTLRLSNQCLVPIDMIEIQVVPLPTDVLQLGDGETHSLQAKTTGDFTATILVPKDSHSVRELIVTYYVWGVSFQLKATYDGK